MCTSSTWPQASAGCGRHLIPPDKAGVYSIIEFVITPDGQSYFYSYTRLLSQLYLVHGLK